MKFWSLVQAGFMVARRDPEIYQKIVDVILEGDFSEGWGHSSGK